MDNILSLLGLAYRAKKMYLGEANLENIKKIYYLFIAKDASDKTKERYLKKCSYYNIPYNMNYSYEQLSQAIGKRNVKIIGINDKGFGSSILKKLK